MDGTTSSGFGKLVKAGAVAERLDVPVSWVREHTRNGYVPHILLGRYVRYDLDEIDAWLRDLGDGGGPWRRYKPRLAN